MTETIGFVGVGQMGNPMARNLLRRGKKLFIHDAVPSATDNLVELGATVCESAARVASEVQLVITMLPSSPHVRAAVLGNSGLIEGLQPGSTLLDMSTISPETSREVAKVLAERGVRTLDAPVVGGPAACEEGTLTVMVGGDRAVFDETKAVFELLGKNVFYVGESGAGQVLKLIGNLTGAVLTVVSLEALLIGKKLGVAEDRMAEVMKLTVGGWFWERTVPNKVLQRDFEPGFALRLMDKDLRLVMEAAESVGVPSLSGAVTRQLYRAAMNRGLADREWTAILELLEENAGVKLSPQ